MRSLIVACLIAFPLSGCLQTENSSSLDEDTYGNINGTAEFLAARAIFTNSCGGSCHSFHTQSETDLKLAGLFVAGSPDTSKLYCRLIGAPSSCSLTGNNSKNMPLTGGALSSSDLNTIRFWILNASP